MHSIRKTTALLCALIGSLSAAASATVIEDSTTLNIDGGSAIFRDFRGDSSTRTSGDRLALSVQVSDASNPGSPPAGNTEVIVKQIDNTTNQNETGFSRVLPPFFSPSLPNEFATTVAWDPSFSETAWKIIAKNPPSNEADREVRLTPDNTIPAGDHLPLVTDVTLDGAGNLSWRIPPTTTQYNQYRVVAIRESDRKQVANGGRIPVSYVPGGQQISVNINSFTGTLDPNEKYELRIETTNFDNTRDISRQVNRSSTFFSFSLLPSNQPSVYLPTLDPAGVFNFDFGVSANQTYNIDPKIAVGYEYAVGENDPLFASILILGDFTGPSGLYELVIGSQSHGLAPGETFNFGPNGVASFSILGIDPAFMLDPADTTAFISTVSFIADGRFTGTMTPIVSAVAVPVPATVALLFPGLTCIGWLRRRKYNAA